MSINFSGSGTGGIVIRASGGGGGGQGPQGDVGPQGPQGVAGSNGVQGANGAQGPQGVAGSQGAQGANGSTGQGFVIAQVYNSVAALLAGSVPDGQFGLVAGSLDQNDPDYGKLYLYSSGAWVYQTDMSVQGIQGPQGVAGSNGSQGAQGAQGATGAGTQGPQGASGANGGAAVYDVSAFVEGKPTAGEVVLRYMAVRAFTLDTTGSNHKGKANTSATATSVINVQKNGITFITASFAATSATPTIGVTNVTSCNFAVGDILTVTMPASVDATLSDIYLTLKGTTV